MAATIRVNLDLLLVKRRMSLTELSEKVGITMANLSILKRGKARAIRFSTLIVLCEVLQCTPGDLLELDEQPIDGSSKLDTHCKQNRAPTETEVEE
jgi:putative transcriptional regulator